MTYRFRNIAIAVVLAAIAVVLTVLYVTNYKKDVRTQEANVTVYVAARDIPEGTPGSKVASDGYLQAKEIAQRAATPDAVTSPNELQGLYAADAIYEGEQVTARRFTTQQEQGLRADITGTTRALQVPGDKFQLLAGTLKADDHVDVVASLHYTARQLTPGQPLTSAERVDRVASRVVLRDLLVLRAAQLDTGDDSITNAADDTLSVVLAVTDAQATKLFFVLRNGDWTLQLRPNQKAADSPERVETVETVLGDGLNEAQFKQLVGGFVEGAQ